MWYSYLLTSPELELPILYNGLDNEKEVCIIGTNFISRRRGFWDIFKKEFSRTEKLTYGNNAIYSFTGLNYDIVVGKGYVGVVEDDQINLLVLETNKALYIDKEFETTYRKLYLKLKSEILIKFNSDKDIVYTNNCGKNSFYQFEKPKCKSISERNEYVTGLLEEYYENR